MINGWSIDDEGTRRWFENDQLNDPPTIEHTDGAKFWLRDGQYHRIGRPATISANGSKCWYENGLLHREDGPACEWWRGMVVHKNVMKNGGSVAIRSESPDEWWIRGVRIMVNTKDEFDQYLIDCSLVQFSKGN